MSKDNSAIRVGSTWRRKKNGVLVRIAALRNHSSAWNPTPYYDISWESVEKPTRRGQSYEDYWLRDYDLVDDAP